MINYNNKIFSISENAVNGEVDANLIFEYKQAGNIVTCKYSGGKILYGHLMALVDDQGCLDMRYHQINKEGKINTGICRSIPTILPDGRIQLNESWHWTSGDGSSGTSILIEVV